MEFRASAIAAAAVLAVIDQKLTIKALESKMNSVSSSGLVETVSKRNLSFLAGGENHDIANVFYLICLRNMYIHVII